MSRTWTNSRGSTFQSGIGGTYGVNAGDQQCDVEVDEDEDYEEHEPPEKNEYYDDWR